MADKPTDFNFINYSGGTAPDPKDENVKKTVRSHVTRLQHRNARQKQLAAYSDHFRSLEPKPGGSIGGAAHQKLGMEGKGRSTDTETLAASGAGATSQVESHQPALTALGRSDVKYNARHRGRELVFRLQRSGSPNTLVLPSARHIASASKLAGHVSRQTILQDPADRLASILSRLHLDFPTVMEHYRWIVFVQSVDFESIFMPELKRGAGYETLASRIARDPALVSAAALVSTGHILAIRNTTMSQHIARCIIELEAFVLNVVNEALRDPTRSTSDSLICAILILASHEGLQGSHENFHVHMRGLIQMINLRGGLAPLNDTQKYLEAFIIWQDTNVSTIMKCEPYWKLAKNHTKELPEVKPNPMMYEDDFFSRLKTNP